jgi:DNA-binding IclR family transcriptional regulator
MAAMGLTLPLSRFTEENSATLMPQIRAAAAEASRALGASISAIEVGERLVA